MYQVIESQDDGSEWTLATHDNLSDAVMHTMARREDNEGQAVHLRHADGRPVTRREVRAAGVA